MVAAESLGPHCSSAEAECLETIRATLKSPMDRLSRWSGLQRAAKRTFQALSLPTRGQLGMAEAMAKA